MSTSVNTNTKYKNKALDNFKKHGFYVKKFDAWSFHPVLQEKGIDVYITYKYGIVDDLVEMNPTDNHFFNETDFLRCFSRARTNSYVLSLYEKTIKLKPDNYQKLYNLLRNLNSVADTSEEIYLINKDISENIIKEIFKKRINEQKSSFEYFAQFSGV